MKIPMKQPKFKEGDMPTQTTLYQTVTIVIPLRYENTEYGWDWVYLIKYLNGSYGETYQIDLKKSN